MNNPSYEELQTAYETVQARCAALESALHEKTQLLHDQTQREHIYRNLLHYAAEGLALIQHGKAVFVNQSLATITGYTTAELEAMSPTDSGNLIHPDDRPLVFERMQQQMVGDDPPQTYHYRLITKEGAIRWVVATYHRTTYRGEVAIQASYTDVTNQQHTQQQLLDQTDLLHVMLENQQEAEQARRMSECRFRAATDGDGIAISMRDITERKHIEQALQASEETFRGFFEQSEEGLVLVNDKGIIIAWNKGSEAIFGIPRELALGKYRWDLVYQVLPEALRTPEVYAGIKRNTLLFIETEGALPQPSWDGQTIHTCDGTQKVVTSLVFPIHTSKGLLVGGIVRDVTSRKQYEDELRQARETAEAATHARSEFLASMSHEIRTPLNAVIGMTSLMLDTSLTPEQRDYIQTIRMSGDTLLTLINDILDFSKIEAGKLDIEQHPFYLRDCVEDTLELLATRAAEKDIFLAYVMEETIPEQYEGDSSRVRQILVNLVSNAVKFTHYGEVIVSVNATPDADATHATLHIRVRDTGIGISPENQTRLFQSFSQIHTATTRGIGGTGLGLMISKRLAEAMGGTMWVESQEGRGSTFHVTLHMPIVLAPIREFLLPNQEPMRGKHALVADTLLTNRFILSNQLKWWGMHVRSSVTADQTISLMTTHTPPFDLAIVGLHRQEIDGIALATQLQVLRPHMPIIMCASVDMRGEERRIPANSTIAAFLVRPLRPATLHDTILTLYSSTSPTPHSSTPRTKQPKQPPVHIPLHILLAEDNVVNQKVAVHMLQTIGYYADVAANGQEVLQALAQKQYHVILMDVQMPELDGLETTRLIRQNSANAQQPHIIAMTAFALKGDRERCLQAGMNDYISKPVRIAELQHKIQDIAYHIAQQQQPTTAHSLPAHDATTTHEKGHGAIHKTIHTATVADTNTSAIDRTVFEQFGHIMGDKTAYMVQLFVDDAGDKITHMHTAVAQRNSTQLFHMAHSLKSSSGQIGALVISQLCAKIEQQISIEQLQAAYEVVRVIDREFQRVKQVLL